MTMEPTLDAAVLEKLISAAVAAPSIHNTQPWRYRLDPDEATLEVCSVPERSLRHADPRGRALHVSVGAALYNLRLAVCHAGWEPQVELLPRPQPRPDLLAVVRLGRGRRASRAETDLYDAIWRRHSSRRPFSEAPLPEEATTRLREAATAEGALLRFAAGRVSVRLLQLTAEAERRNEDDPERRAESRGWVRDAGRDGIPFPALGPPDAERVLPMRAFSDPGPGGRPAPARFERHPVVAVLSTPHDRRVDWLRAGQALEHVLLTATVNGVRASLLHQAVEWPDLRAAVLPSPVDSQQPQILVRFGYGPEGPATPRRPVSDVLEAPERH